MKKTKGVMPVSGKLLFKFAVVTDTHIRLPEDAHLTPWKGQSQGAERARMAMRQIAASKPDFLLHLGDIVQPVPHMPSHKRTAEFASTILAEARMEIHAVPGNHDVGDKCTAVTPAHEIDQFSVDTFEALVGTSYRSFERGGLMFLTINSSLIGSGLPAEEEQFLWLERELELHPDKRKFLFLHYPLFMGDPAEPSYYDNVEEPGRGRILSLLSKCNVEAVLAGHVHNYFYHNIGETEFYSLLSTCFVRHDYAEMFNVEPANEYGRDDLEKLGWAEVEIYESGHILTLRRMFEPGYGTLEAPSYPDLAIPHPKRRLPLSLGAHVRSAWAELHTISINGPVDEFVRRKVRNDYELWGWSETGIRALRVPLTDLDEPPYLSRMETLAQSGFEFTLFHAGLPELTDARAQAIERLGATVELTLQWHTPEQHIEGLRQLRQKTAAKIFVASTVSASDHRSPEFKGGYVPMSFGFDHSEFKAIEEFHALIGEELDLGYVFRIPPRDSVLVVGREIADWATRVGVSTTLNVTLVGENPATMPADEAMVAARVAEAVVIGAAYEQVLPFVDTFVDQDRGYFPRQGLYDGRMNRRQAGRVAAHLVALLTSNGTRPILGKLETKADGLVQEIELEDRQFKLILPRDGAFGLHDGGTQLDLSTGLTGPERVFGPYLLTNPTSEKGVAA